LGAGGLTINGGTLNNSANIGMANNILIPGYGGTIQLGSANNFTLTGTLSGSGTLTLGGSGALSSLYLGFSANTFSNGVITIPNSTGNNQTVVRFSAAAAGSATAAWSIGGAQDRGTTFDFGPGTIQFGSLSGSGLIQGNSSGIHTMSVGALNTDSTFSGIIKDNSGTIALLKTGTGTFWLTGANTYTGTNNINAGELIVSTASMARGNYTVAAGATFGVTNTTSGSAIVSNLTAAAGAQLEFLNVASLTTPLLAASNVTVNGSCTVKITGTNGLVAGNSYPLVSYAGTFSGAFTDLQLQMPYGWRGKLANSGNQISLTSVAVVATTAPLLSLTNNGAQLQFGWPATHTGWRLQSQTNLMATTWLDVPGAGATNLIFISPTNPSAYFRMVYP